MIGVKLKILIIILPSRTRCWHPYLANRRRCTDTSSSVIANSAARVRLATSDDLVLYDVTHERLELASLSGLTGDFDLPKVERSNQSHDPSIEIELCSCLLSNVICELSIFKLSVLRPVSQRPGGNFCDACEKNNAVTSYRVPVGNIGTEAVVLNSLILVLSVDFGYAFKLRVPRPAAQRPGAEFWGA